MKRDFSYIVYTYFWAWALLAIAAVGVMSYFFIFSDQVRVLVEDLSVARQQEILEARQQYLARLALQDKNFKSIDNDDIDIIESMLPIGRNAADVYQQIERFAQENGTVILSIEMRDIMQQERSGQKQIEQTQLTKSVEAVLKDAIHPEQFNVRKMQVIVTLGGQDYVPFRNFLTAIQKNLRIMDITSISFEPKSQKHTVHLLTYYLDLAQ